MSETTRFSEYAGQPPVHGVPDSHTLPEVLIGDEGSERQVETEDYMSAKGTEIIGVDGTLGAENNHEPEGTMTQTDSAAAEPGKEENVAAADVHDAVVDQPTDNAAIAKLAENPTNPRWQFFTGDTKDRPAPKHYPKVVCATGEPDFAEQYERGFQQLRRTPLPHEAEKTEAEVDHIDRCNEAIVAIGDRIGVDMRDRLQPPEEHHFFNTRAEKDTGIRERWGDYADRAKASEGSSTPFTGIVVARETADMREGCLLPHEKAHGVSIEYVSTREVSEGTRKNVFSKVGRVESGYGDLAGSPARTPPTPIVNELAADIVGWETRLAIGETPTRPAYPALAIVGGHAIAAIADNFGVKPRDVADKLVLGYWTTDRCFVDLAGETFGNAIAPLFHMPVRHMPWHGEMLRLAIDWRLDGAVADLHKLNAGQPVNFFDWYRDLYSY
jgi:hypothetical protein